jgi:drug/metabolite transporter (DMT)-like permease
MAVVLLGIAWALPVGVQVDVVGAALAVASGAITSGMGYAVWYSALRGLASATAASVQLGVPVLTAVAGVVLLSEPLTLRIVVSSTAVLGGIAMVVLARRPT